jgi:hypothetical protein
MTQATEQNKEIVREMLKVLERQDFAALEVHPGLYEMRRFHPLNNRLAQRTARIEGCEPTHWHRYLSFYRYRRQ